MIKALIMNELLYEVGKVTFLLGILNNLRYFLVAGIPFLVFYIFYSKKFHYIIQTRRHFNEYQELNLNNKA
jgi:hypothetical protein